MFLIWCLFWFEALWITWKLHAYDCISDAMTSIFACWRLCMLNTHHFNLKWCCINSYCMFGSRRDLHGHMILYAYRCVLLHFRMSKRLELISELVFIVLVLPVKVCMCTVYVLVSVSYNIAFVQRIKHEIRACVCQYVSFFFFFLST